jgi:hypothetical protein
VFTESLPRNGSTCHNIIYFNNACSNCRLSLRFVVDDIMVLAIWPILFQTKKNVVLHPNHKRDSIINRLGIAGFLDVVRCRVRQKTKISITIQKLILAFSVGTSWIGTNFLRTGADPALDIYLRITDDGQSP